MMTISDSSCRHWITRLQAGDDAAAERLWNAFFNQLVQFAHSRLQARYRQVQDPEDVALSAFTSLCRGVEQNKYPALAEKDSLWKLLVVITINKVRRVVRDQNRLKRGGESLELASFGSSLESLDILTQSLRHQATPDFVLEVAEQYSSLLQQLDAPDLAEIATMKFEGYTNAEIAKHQNRSERTIERKLNLIRKIWLHLNVEGNK
jgi:DNA-directed RNA polymerase specialized sigma24 family protein